MPTQLASRCVRHLVDPVSVRYPWAVGLQGLLAVDGPWSWVPLRSPCHDDRVGDHVARPAVGSSWGMVHHLFAAPSYQVAPSASGRPALFQLLSRAGSC